MGSQFKYVICPRCELNYIREDEEYCSVCKAELENQETLTDVLEEEDKEVILCPVCKINYITVNEKMCQQCKIEQKSHAVAEKDWTIDDVEPIKEDEVSLSQIIEEEEEDDELDLTDEELLDIFDDSNE